MLICYRMYFLSHSLSVEERTPAEVRRMVLAKVRDLTWQLHHDVKSGLQTKLIMPMLQDLLLKNGWVPCALLELQEILQFFALIWDVNLFALRYICQQDHLVLCPQSGIAQHVLSAIAHITRTSSPYSGAVSFHFSSG